MLLNQIRKNKKEGPSSSTRESDDLPMLSEHICCCKKSRTARGLCISKPRKDELLRPKGSTSRGHRVTDRGALPRPLHLHGSGFFSQRQRVILRLLPFVLLVHYDQQRPAFRGKRAGAS